MRMLAVAVYDSKAAVFTAPVFVLSEAQAARSFGDSVNSGKSDYSAHPEDYTLFAVGSFDDSTGEIVAATPKSLGNGVTFLKAVL